MFWVGGGGGDCILLLIGAPFGLSCCDFNTNCEASWVRNSDHLAPLDFAKMQPPMSNRSNTAPMIHGSQEVVVTLSLDFVVLAVPVDAAAANVFTVDADCCCAEEVPVEWIICCVGDEIAAEDAPGDTAPAIGVTIDSGLPIPATTLPEDAIILCVPPLGELAATAAAVFEKAF